MIRYRIDVLAYLKKCGYTQFRLKKECWIAGGVLDKLRNHDTDISLKTLDMLCKLKNYLSKTYSNMFQINQGF